MKKRITAAFLAVILLLGLLPTATFAAASEEEALGEVDIYNGGYTMSYLTINGRVREQVYTYYNHVSPSGQVKEVPAYCVNPNTKGVPQSVEAGESIKYLAKEKASDPKVTGIIASGYPNRGLYELGLDDKYQAYYATHSKIKTRPYDGILEALAEIAKEFPIAVVSNKPDIATKPLCREYFGEGIFALGESSACPRKPAPDMFYQAMKAIGVEKCIYVGDSEVDVLTAKNAGVPCLSVLWGFRDKACLAEHGATHFCDDPKKMLTALKEMV